MLLVRQWADDSVLCVERMLHIESGKQSYNGDLFMSTQC